MRACAGQTTHLDYMLYVWQVDMFFVRIWKYFSIHNLYILRLAKTNISIFSRERFRSFVECLSSTHTCIVCGCWCWMKIVFFFALGSSLIVVVDGTVCYFCMSIIYCVCPRVTHTHIHTHASKLPSTWIHMKFSPENSISFHLTDCDDLLSLFIFFHQSLFLFYFLRFFRRWCRGLACLRNISTSSFNQFVVVSISTVFVVFT